MDPATHREMIACQKRLLAVLRRHATPRRRARHADWADREILAVQRAANRWARRHGLDPIPLHVVRRMDDAAAGHVDWASKLCLYTAEALYRGGPR